MRFRTTFVLLAIFLMAGTAPVQAQYLHTSGTALVDGSGNPIQLRGVNLGSWLFTEGWMLSTPFSAYLGEDGATDTFTQAVVNLVGTAKAATFWAAYRNAYVTSADIARIHQLGFNCVRVPLDFQLFYDPASGTYLTSNYTYLDNLLNWCAANGVYAILDMHNMPGGKDIRNANSVYVNTTYQTILATIWQNIASRYATNTALAGYDLINEPVVNGSATLRSLSISLTQSIRQVDTNHTIFVEGDWYASQLGLLGKPWDANMCYSDHNYWSALPNNLPTDQNMATANNTPLYMGEFGDNSNTWDSQQVAYLNQTVHRNGRDIQASWTCWAWKATGIWPLYNIKIPSAYQTLINYWNGQGTQPNQTTAYNALLSLVTAVTYANCVFNKDVADGYTRANFATDSLPYTTRFIPGQIAAVQYDMGAEGVAYHDTNSSNTNGSGANFTAWNTGWTYRNDGVDITSTGDGGTGFAVGWIDSGEWTNYTVNCLPGNYNIKIRYSGPGGQMHIALNGTNITGTVTLPKSPNNGDWNSYTTLTVPNVLVTAFGTATMQLSFDVAGYNINWVEFDAVTSAIPLGRTIAFRAVANNQYVSAENAGADPLLASRTTPSIAAGSGETYQVVNKGNGLVALLALANNRYVSADLSLNNPPKLIASQTTVSASEEFKWIDQGNQKFALFSLANNQYVTADLNTSNPPPLIASRSAISDRETFLFENRVTVSGQLTFEGIAPAAPMQNVLFDFRPTDGSSEIAQVVPVPPSGVYAVTLPIGKTYTMHVKSDHYLAANVNITANANLANVDMPLPAGDANSDNVVDIADFGILVDAYGSLASDTTSGYDPHADLNSDGFVDVGDFGLLVNNYGLSGDP